jgi:voltage-gated potassium channel
MKKQEQENVVPQPTSRSHVAAYFGESDSGFRDHLFVIIFEAETRAGRWFDFSLIAAILLSVVVMLDSVSGINHRYGGILNALEWFFTVAFTIE